MKKRKLLLFAILVLTISSGYGQSLNDSLKAYYLFDNSLADSANNNHLSPAVGVIRYDSINPINSSIYFDGFSSISSTTVFNNSSYSRAAVSLWIKTNNNSSSNQSILQGAYLGFGIFLQANTSKIAGFFGGSSANAIASFSSISNNTWQHIVLQNDGTRTYLYVNGVFNGSIADQLVVGNGLFNNRIYFGRTNLNLASYTGNVDDVRIYNRILSMSEIIQLYNKNIALSLEESKTESQHILISAYPNPSNGLFNINLGRIYPFVRIEILDMVGKSVYELNLEDNQFIELDLDAPSGIYFAKIQIGVEQHTLKLVKK